MSGLINKVKEAVHSDKKDNAATNDPRSTNAGPHGSNMANTVDPRVDSDRDNLNQPGGVGGAGYGNQGAGIGGGPGHVGHGQHGGAAGVGSTGAGYGGPGNPQSGNAGPHSSNIANRADPRVDSDLDGGRNLGGAGGHGGAGYGSNTGVGGGYGGPGNPQSSNAGPHSSNFANKADPRVDSDLDGGRNFGAAGGHGATGGAGYGSNTGVGGGYGGPGNPQSSNAGPHSSNIANSADPRVDSDLVRSSPYTSSNLANNFCRMAVVTLASAHQVLVTLLTLATKGIPVIKAVSVAQATATKVQALVVQATATKVQVLAVQATATKVRVLAVQATTSQQHQALAMLKRLPALTTRTSSTSSTLVSTVIWMAQKPTVATRLIARMP